MVPLRVIATAGHVDHGKSALILRLTGMDPDRLAEEKRRGLTIDLGFAWTTLRSGAEVGFVDVPGHERFVRNMLAGVGPVRLVLFVVAADEGWKPQSEEHLQILDVLGVHGAVVALTHSESGMKLLVQLRERGIGTVVMGPSTWSNKKFLTDVDDKYTKDVFLTSSFMYEVANDKAYAFQKEYTKRFGTSPPTAAALAYDSLFTLVETIKALDTEKPGSATRPFPPPRSRLST